MADETKNVSGLAETTRLEGLGARLGHDLDSSFNEIYVFDAQSFRFTQVNEGAQNNLGYTPQELSDMTPWDLEPEFDEQSFRKVIEPLLRGEKEVLVFETRHMRKNGSCYPVEVRLQLSSAGMPPVFVAVVADISERKRVEAALRVSNWRLEQAQRIANIGSWEWDIVTNDLAWSDQIYRIFGLAPQEFGASYPAFLERVHPEDRSHVEESVRRAIEERAPYSIDHRILLPDGEIRTVHEQGEVDFSPTGQPLRMLGTVQDVTALRKIEMDLQQSQEALSGILRISPEAIIVCDAEMQISIFSGGAEEIFGYTASEVIGRTLNCLIPDRVRHIHDRYIRDFAASKVVSKRMSERSEVAGLRKNGEEFPAEVSLSRLDTPNGTVFTAILRDVTAQKAAQSELLEAKRTAEAASEAKSRFLANMSHELRTPMNGIIGTIDLLMRTDLDANQAKKLRTVHESAEALLSIIGDILDFSKIEAGELTIDKTEMSIRHVVDDVVATLTPIADSKNVVLTVFASPKLPQFVQGDPVRVRQVLLNLVGNAIKFSNTQEDRSCEVTVRIEPRARQSDGKVVIRFSVVDSGIGIAEDQLANLFAPFSQAEASTTRRFGGSGLGLSICKNLVDLMNGDIWVQSRVGHGSTFTFELPFVVLSGKATVSNGAVDADAESGDLDLPLERVDRSCVGPILLAEDNIINQAVLEEQLKILGFDVRVASNGEEALRLLDQERFGLLITDCHMPEMDGYELAQEIRRRERGTTERLPIVAITANVVQEQLDRCLVVGMDSYLTKPCSIDKLSNSLEKLLGVATNEESGHALFENAGRADASDKASTMPRDVNTEVSAQTDGPVDLDVLSQALGTDDHARLMKMLSLFGESMADSLAELRQLFNARDARSFATAAHTAKGATASVGASRVSSMLKQLEKAALGEDWEQIEAMMPEFEAAFGDLEHYIRSVDAA